MWGLDPLEVALSESDCPFRALFYPWALRRGRDREDLFGGGRSVEFTAKLSLRLLGYQFVDHVNDQNPLLIRVWTGGSNGLASVVNVLIQMALGHKLFQIRLEWVACHCVLAELIVV